jgi:prepilin-type N-terminal cleavage/methylation domain-containing protein
MSIVRNIAARARRAFTLLEVMLAVAILAMVGVSIYQFVDVNLRAVQAASVHAKQDSAMRGLAALLQAQLNGLQPKEQNALFGQAHVFQNAASDVVTWAVQSNNGLLTKDASGNYFVTLMLRPSQSSTGSKAGNPLELGMQRILAYDANNNAQLAAQGSTASQNNGDWVHLLDDVAAFEVRYFTTGDTDWSRTDWTNLTTLPRLIRVRVWKKIDDDPVEVVLNVPLKVNGQ